MERRTRNIVTLLIRGEDGSVRSQADVGKTQSVGENGGGFAV